MGCHQKAERSFSYKGLQFPVCARCTGVIIGYIVALPLYFYFGCSLQTCIKTAVIMFLDWFIQYKSILDSTNLRRLITGILGGYGVASFQIILVYSALSMLLE